MDTFKLVFLSLFFMCLLAATLAGATTRLDGGKINAPAITGWLTAALFAVTNIIGPPV